MKQKAFFIFFKGFLDAKNCLRPLSAPLRLTVERFQRLCHVQFSLMLTLTWGIEKYLKSYHQKQKVEFEKHPLHYASGDGWGFHGRPVFFFNIFSRDLHFDALILGFC